MGYALRWFRRVSRPKKRTDVADACHSRNRFRSNSLDALQNDRALVGVLDEHREYARTWAMEQSICEVSGCASYVPVMLPIGFDHDVLRTEACLATDMERYSL